MAPLLLLLLLAAACLCRLCWQQGMQALVQADVAQLQQQWRKRMLHHVRQGVVDIWEMQVAWEQHSTHMVVLDV
jgi:hypothetical protein